jgi:hypothetical protein
MPTRSARIEVDHMGTVAGLLGLVTLAGGVYGLVTGDSIMAVDCLVISGLSFAVWGVTRRNRQK